MEKKQLLHRAEGARHSKFDFVKKGRLFFATMLWLGTGPSLPSLCAKIKSSRTIAVKRNSAHKLDCHRSASKWYCLKVVTVEELTTVPEGLTTSENLQKSLAWVQKFGYFPGSLSWARVLNAIMHNTVTYLYNIVHPPLHWVKLQW